ncbi:MAG: polysaccharide deacetylase family protein [Vagococcus sp.]|uniref:polysaccharide deacetylase family protein n=2 Tax=Vagococcus sp. TaxID=1933889 RepID=UPI002FCC197B
MKEKYRKEKAVISMFKTLVFHEIRPEKELELGMRPVIVANGYQDQLPMPLFNSVPFFEQEMVYLKENGYHFLTLDELKSFFYEKKQLPDKSILITFDDCFQSMKKHAYPILKKMNIPAVCFAPTGWLFETESDYSPNESKALSFQELENMRDVFTYANHTHDFHVRRGIEASKLMWETTENVLKDLAKCSQWVEETDVFAYPFGLYDEKNVALLKEHDFKLAFTTKQGTTTINTHPLEIERYVIPFTMNMEEFEQVITK